MVGRHRIAVDHAVESIDGSERRRVAVAAGVPALFALVVELRANLGVLPLVVAGALAVYLYTRGTGQALLAASAYGTGLLLVGLFLLQLYLGQAAGSTESPEAAVVRHLGWLLAGTALVALGLWLDRVDLSGSRR